ncbi:MAG: hypothetical protein HY369_00215 [Candidatus Aenigmarchaeota archaeon]|nr:hypothetical protein [Candidatus Aenigmarchaeota archaeon]
MHAAVKVIAGLIVLVIGLALLVDSVIPLSGRQGTTIGGITINWFDNFAIVVTGVIPILLILVGLFVVWLEADELKARKEIAEPEPAKKDEKKK